MTGRDQNTRAQAIPSAKNASPVPGSTFPHTELSDRVSGRGRTPRMVPTSEQGTRLSLVSGERGEAPVLGADGTPLYEPSELTADRCARYADELAAHAENVGRLAKALLHGPSGPDPAWTRKFTRVAMTQLAELRVLACGLGELHTELDELAAALTSSPRAAGELLGGA